jgi:ribose 5-phosphate isomerase B
MAITANKTPGIRAANISSEYEARMSREHNDLNVLTLGARILDEGQAMVIVDVWLNTRFAGGRHQQRLEKLAGLETPKPLTESLLGCAPPKGVK